MNPANKLTGVQITIIIVIILILVFTLGNKVINEILEALNMKDTKEEAAEKAKETGARISAESSDFWKPTFFQTQKAKEAGAALLTQASADKLAKQIKSSIGYIYDDPEEAEGAFNQLKTKSQLSFLAWRFNALYNTDMYAYLNDKFDTTYQRQVFTRIINRMNSLPAYRA